MKKLFWNRFFTLGGWFTYAALIIGAGAVIGGTVSAVGSSQAGKKAGKASSAAAGAYREDSARAASSLERYKDKLSRPDLLLLDAIKGNLSNLPQANRLAQQVNRGNQSELTRMLQTVLPGYNRGVRGAIQNTLSMIKGQIPDDVAKQIQDVTGQQAIVRGFGGSPAARALTARDLGRTSLSLMEAGSNSLQRWLATARESLMPKPFDPTAFFVSPDLAFRSVEDAAGIAEKQAQLILGGANAATGQELEGAKARAAATQQMYQSIGAGISGAAGGIAGNFATPAGGGGGYQNYLNSRGSQAYSYDPSTSSYIPIARPTQRGSIYASLYQS